MRTFRLIFSRDVRASVVRVAECEPDTGAVGRAFGDEYLESLMKNEPRSRAESLCGALLLLSLTEELGLPPGTIVRGESGKPRFEDAGMPGFSISHDGGLVLAAVNLKGNAGADVTVRGRIRPENAEKMAARCFSPEEARLIASTPAEEKAELFSVLWADREAASKYFGGRLAEGFGKPLPDNLIYRRFGIIDGDTAACATVCLPPAPPERAAP